MKNVVASHILCFVNGRLYGQVTAISWSQATPRIERRGIDSGRIQEMSASGTWIEGEVRLLRVHGDGGLEARGVVAPDLQVNKEQYFSLLLVNRRTGTRLLQCDNCSVERQSWSAVAKGRMEGSFSFKGIDVTPESDY